MQRARGWCGRSLTVNKKPLRARQSVDVALVTADTSEGLFLTVDVCPLRRVTSKREVPCLRHALPELHSEAPLGSWPPELGSREPPGPRGGHAAQLADPRPGAHRRGGPHAAWAAAAGASAFRVDQADLPPSSVLEWALRGHPQQARPARGA